MSKNILQNIIEKKIEKVDKLKKSLDMKTLDNLIIENSSYINFKEKIENNIKMGFEIALFSMQIDLIPEM